MNFLSFHKHLVRDLFFTVLLILLSGCIEREKSILNQALWSSMDPMTIPYPVRLNQLHKGNLVFNPSFETGKFFFEEGKDNAFFVKGWTRVGEHVEWVDLSKGFYAEDEVTMGTHAIKISREKSGEMDETGEGIISDFIKVVSGNYLFTFDIRLEDIHPNKSRLGTKLHDAINIRILFFDKNKIELDGKQYYPYLDEFLDNSFKGYPFSNFWFIDSFGYGNVRGRTYNYPFSEGDIPDDAQFVRIFFGIKGTGTMWVDNVDYRFSKWNFTTMERVSPYFDSVFSRADLILPTPKQIRKGGILTYFSADSAEKKVPLIIIPSNPSALTLKAANLIKEEIEKNDAIQVSVSRSVPPDVDDYSILFNIGKTDLYYRSSGRLNASIPDGKPQSYLLDVLEDHTPVVFLVGSEPVGDYYATATALQLVDTTNRQFHGASISDYPDFLGRSYLFDSWQDEAALSNDLADIDRMSLMKFNKAYIGYGQTRGRKAWYDPDDLFKHGVKMIGEACRKNGAVDLAIMINPYYHFDYEMHVDSIPHDLRYAWTHSDPESMEKLRQAFSRGLDAGATAVMLMADDFIPHETGSRKLYTLYTEEDEKAYGSLQYAHAHIINSLYRWVEMNYPGTRFEFCPPWYLNEFIDRSMGRAEYYFKDLVPMIPENISIIWTGPTVRSLYYDKIDFEKYTQLIGRKPMIWDNTLYARALESDYGGYAAIYPGKVRMCNLFEPYDVYVPENFYRYIDGPHMYVNGSASSEFYKIKYSTVADFEWNNNGYDPDLSLWKTLLSHFGKDIARQLIEFNDAYYGLTDICMKIEEGSISNRLSKQGELFSEKLHILYSSLSGSLKSNPGLVEELSAKKEGIIQRFSELDISTGTLFHRDSARSR